MSLHLLVWIQSHRMSRNVLLLIISYIILTSEEWILSSFICGHFNNICGVILGHVTLVAVFQLWIHLKHLTSDVMSISL